jgi:hypothetical protein
MPSPKRSKTSVAALREAYRADLAAAWAYSRRRHANETPYAFVLYGVEGGPRLSPHVLTEEGLTRVAQRFLDKAKGIYETLDDAREGLRYSVADSPSFDELEGRIPTVDALMGPHVETMGDVAGYKLLATAAIDALRELDGQGLFGAGAERERLLLVIITEDVEEDWTLKSARRLNPEATYKRFEKHHAIEGVFARCDVVVAAPDGGSVYATGLRADPAAKPGTQEEFRAEIVAYDLADGRHLVRRWKYSIPSFGDSARALACTPDGESLLVVRAKYTDQKCKALLMRFGQRSDRPIAEAAVAGEPASFAMRPDGARVAVGMQDKTLHVLDVADFRPLQVHKLDAKPQGLRFLQSGELLMATETGVLRIDAETGAGGLAAAVRAFRLVTDDAEQLLAVSRWFAFSGPERERPVEFGVQLLRLPSFEPVRTFLLPGHQAVTAALSPDGRLLAFEAHEIGTYRRFVVAFDVATGRELGRRKSDFVRDLAFLRDGRTLAIPKTGNTTSEPIDLWAVPE